MSELSSELWPLALVLARVLPLAWALSTLTAALVPRPVALSLALALSATLLPIAGSVGAPLGVAGIVLGLLRELCIGGTFALSISLSLSAIAWTVRFSQVAGAHASVDTFARVYALSAAWLVLSLGGLSAIVIGLSESFRDAALGGAKLGLRTFALGAAQLVADAFAAAFGFALPLLFGVWLLEGTVALLTRVVSPAGQGQTSIVRPLLFFVVAALLLVPTVSFAPEAVRSAIASARALTRALAR